MKKYECALVTSEGRTVDPKVRRWPAASYWTWRTAIGYMKGLKRGEHDAVFICSEMVPLGDRHASFKIEKDS